MRHGGRFLTPNAHRCLRDAWVNVRVAKDQVRSALRKLRDAVRWQLKGF